MALNAVDPALHVLMVPSFYPTPENPYNGTFFRDWALALQRAGVRTGVAYAETRSLRSLSVAALGTSRFQLTSVAEDGLPTVRVKGWNTLAQWTGGGLVWSRIVQRAIQGYIARHGRPDILAAQSATWAGDAAWRASHATGIPYVITEVNTGFGTGRIHGWEATVSRRAFASATAVVAISQNLHDRLHAFGGVRRLVLVPCTVDEDYWSPPPAPRAAAPFTFYAQAHLSPRKGFDILIRAFAAQFRGDEGTRLMIGGDGSIRADLEALAAASGVHRQVTFLGGISRDAVREAMRGANAFVLPSLAENFGVVLIEAMATGLPVIATKCGGPEDFVNDGVGSLIEPGDEHGLGQALLRLRHGQAFDARAVRSYAVERFGYAAVGPQLRDLYLGVLHR